MILPTAAYPKSSTTFPMLPAASVNRTADAAPRKMRICIASFDFVGPVKNGGVGTAFTSLAEGLAAAGHDVTCLFLAGNWCENQTLDHWIAHYAANAITFVPLPESCIKINSRWHLGKAHDGYAWLKKNTFDVVHFSEWKGPGYFCLEAKRQGLAFATTHLCVHTHGPTHWHKLSNGEFITNIDEIELDFIERRSVELADTVVSPSQYLLRWMSDRDWIFSPATFVRQYLRPATARAPKPDADRIHPVRELVFFGRLEVRKGLVLFCDALDLLAQEPAARSLKLTFLGKIDQINGLDSADYLAERAQNWPWPPALITNRDQAGAMDYLQGPGRIALLPSLVDNLPNTVLECLGAGIPFLTSDAGGIPEMIHPDDRATICFQLRARDFSDKLSQALARGLRPARHAVDSAETEACWVAWHEALDLTPTAAPAPAAGSPPLVSICMSHWNRPVYLRQALAAIEAQDYPNYEVVLIDDGSTDPAALAVLDELEPVFAQRGWQLLRNETNCYPGAARNRAAQAARGEYLLFTDDDNCAKPHEASTLVAVARRNGADIVTCCLDVFSGHDAPDHETVPTERWLFLGADTNTGALRNNFGDTNGLWRRETFLAVGGFHEDWGVGHEDWEILARAVLAGYKLVTVPDPLAWYRLNRDEASVNRKTPPVANYQANLRPYLEKADPAMRHLLLFAQGSSLRVTPNGRGSLTAYARHTLEWRAKLEAALALLAIGQRRAAHQLMMTAVKAVEGCKDPIVIIEALIEVGTQLAPIDLGRATYFLQTAEQAAVTVGVPSERKRARDALANLPQTRGAATTAG
jgi:glycosyltransferase involved in cell wall biosynthesis